MNQLGEDNCALQRMTSNVEHGPQNFCIFAQVRLCPQQVVLLRHSVLVGSFFKLYLPTPRA
jgi:hypothetical protein